MSFAKAQGDGVRKGFKQTEIGPIPEDWELRGFDRTLSVANGQVDPRIEPFASMTLVAPDHVEDSTGRLLQRHTAKSLGARSGKYLVRPGDIVYSKIRPYLRKAIFSDFEGLCSADMYPLSPLDGVHGKFAFHLILGPRFSHFAETVSARSGIPKINRTELSEFRFLLPPLPEQQAIAEALSDVDGLIAGLEALVGKKRDLKQAAAQTLLTGETRLPGFSGEWREVTLGELARVLRGASPRPIESPRWFDDNSSVGWLRISDLTASNRFLRSTTQSLSDDGIKNSRFVPSGSLVMSICATVGRPIVTEIDVCIHDGFVVFENPTVDQSFLLCVLTRLEPEWGKRGQTGSQMNLNTGLIGSREITIPPTIDEQSAIATILSDMDAEIEALEAQVAKTRDLKTGMMQDLLTGRVRLTGTGERRAA